MQVSLCVLRVEFLLVFILRKLTVKLPHLLSKVDQITQIEVKIDSLRPQLVREFVRGIEWIRGACLVVCHKPLLLLVVLVSQLRDCRIGGWVVRWIFKCDLDLLGVYVR